VYTRPWTVTIPAKKYVAGSLQDDWHNQRAIATGAS